MPHPLVKFIAILLLLAQGVVGAAPGRVVCFSLGDCEGRHAPCHDDSHGCGVASACGSDHSDPAPCPSSACCEAVGTDESGCVPADESDGTCPPSCNDSSDSLIAVALHFATDCGSECCCRLHVPLRGEPQIPARAVTTRASADASPAPQPPSVTLGCTARSPETMRAAIRRAPDFAVSAQVLALEATRLLI